MNKEIEKHLIPDLSNIVMDFVSGTKEYWRTQMNKSIEQFKTRRLSIYTNGWKYSSNKKPIELTLFMRYIYEKEIRFETDDFDDKFYLLLGLTDGFFINSIKKFYLSKFDIERENDS